MSTNFIGNNPKLCALAKLGLKILEPTALIALLVVTLLTPHQAYLAFPVMFVATIYVVTRNILNGPYQLIEYLRSSKYCRELLAMALVGLVSGMLASVFYADDVLPVTEGYWMKLYANIIAFLAGAFISTLAVLLFQTFISFYKWATKTYFQYLEECKQS